MMLKVLHFSTEALSEEQRREMMMPTSDAALIERAKMHFALGHYVTVAEVMGDERHLERAWHQTQNIEGSWSLNPEVYCRPIFPDDRRSWGMRSSMMGDIVEVYEEGRLVSRHMAKTVGFVRLDDPA